VNLISGRVFLQHAARDFRRTGAIAPSSRTLGYAMTSELGPHSLHPLRVLEVGGGTGSITEVIARRLAAGDRLDVYEIDRTFAALIRRRFRAKRRYQEAGVTIRIYNKPIESIERLPRYDFIVSCLPFTNFNANQVREIFEIYRDLLKPGGACSFYEYILVRRAAGLVRSTLERERVKSVARTVRQFTGRYCYKHNVVLRNLPPAIVYYVRFADGAVLPGSDDDV